MTIRFPGARPVLIGMLAVALVATSGCGWFRSKKEPYKTAPENRPLEVPPDLDRPNTDPSMQIPATGAQAGGKSPAAGGAPLAQASQFVLDDAIDSAWRRVGLALERMDGVKVGSRSEALGTVETTYGGQTFLVRLRAQDGATTVSAVAPDGRALGDGPAAELLAQLQARLR
mgnify:CR=1 FL=1